MTNPPAASRLPLLAAALAVTLASQSGCAVYIADQQSARLVPAGEFEVTPTFSSVSFSGDGETEHVQNHLGVRAAYGVSDRLEVRGLFERVTPRDDFGGDAVNMIGAGPKWSLAEGTAAFYLPVGFVFGGDVDVSETWTTAPTLLLTWAADPALEVNTSGKLIFPFTAEDTELLLGFNLGLGIWFADGRVAFRPEAGAVVNPGEEGVSWGWTLGLSFRP